MKEKKRLNLYRIQETDSEQNWINPHIGLVTQNSSLSA